MVWDGTILPWYTMVQYSFTMAYYGMTQFTMVYSDTVKKKKKKKKKVLYSLLWCGAFYQGIVQFTMEYYSRIDYLLQYAMVHLTMVSYHLPWYRMAQFYHGTVQFTMGYYGMTQFTMVYSDIVKKKKKKKKYCTVYYGAVHFTMV